MEMTTNAVLDVTAGSQTYYPTKFSTLITHIVPMFFNKPIFENRKCVLCFCHVIVLNTSTKIGRTRTVVGT